MSVTGWCRLYFDSGSISCPGVALSRRSCQDPLRQVLLREYYPYRSSSQSHWILGLWYCIPKHYAFGTYICFQAPANVPRSSRSCSSWGAIIFWPVLPCVFKAILRQFYECNCIYWGPRWFLRAVTAGRPLFCLCWIGRCMWGYSRWYFLSWVWVYRQGAHCP